jgi:hypothetical protein
LSSVTRAHLQGTFALLYAVAEATLRIGRFTEERRSGTRSVLDSPVSRSPASMAAKPST